MYINGGVPVEGYLCTVDMRFLSSSLDLSTHTPIVYVGAVSVALFARSVSRCQLTLVALRNTSLGIVQRSAGCATHLPLGTVG